jgi:hypothetical protein
VCLGRPAYNHVAGRGGRLPAIIFFGGETVTRTALAEPPSEAAASAWRPMSEAPRSHPILLRAQWAGRPIAIVGEWVEVHGCFCAPALFGHDHQQIFANNWAELPPLLEA